MATDLRTRLVLDAIDMAVTTRKPADVVHHSDQGSQYASVAFIEDFHNPTRRHSALGYLSPIEYEARAMAEND